MANEEAIFRQHDYVGTEHLLLSLIREGEGLGAAVLTNLVVDREELHRLLEKNLRRGKSTASLAELRYTARLKKTIEYAMNSARERGDAYIGTGHLLIGLCREEKGNASKILGELEIGSSQVETKLDELLGTETPQTAALEAMRRTPQTYPTLRALLSATKGSADPTRISVVADTDFIPTSVIAEVMASLDELHRAWGGGGLVIEEDRVVSLEVSTVLK